MDKLALLLKDKLGEEGYKSLINNFTIIKFTDKEIMYKSNTSNMYLILKVK